MSIIDDKIHIIGLGVAEKVELNFVPLKALQHAYVVIGSERQLATVAHLLTETQQCVVLPKLSELKALIESYVGRSVAVLASGDPLYYGIGRWFSERFNSECLKFHPAISSLQAACHRLGRALQDVVVVSLHGRPLASIRYQLKRGACLLVLTDKYSQPHLLAQECINAGFLASILTVCENLGYSTEKITRFSIKELTHTTQNFDPLHVTYIEVLGIGEVQPEFPGIPDTHFSTGEQAGKGMISKREVRLVILSFMQASQDDVIWDIGAGCGGVAVELALWQPQSSVYAVECHQGRLNYLRQNAAYFGVVKNLKIIEGRAPKVLVDLPAPNKVFIGGSDGALSILLKEAWAALPPRGILVASGVIESTKEQLRQFALNLLPQQVECVEVSVQRGQVIKSKIDYTAKLPVEIFKYTKLEKLISQGDV